MVSDGHTLFMTARDAGDEPYMMARRLEFPVFIGQDRYKTGRMALKTLTPDVIILDDGFQHLGLQRDLDIVLMDFHKPRGSNRLLPAGNLREPLASGLKRADIIVFTRCPDTIDILYQQTIIPREITQTNIPCFYTRHVPGLYRYIGGTCPDENNLTQVSQLSGLKVLAFSGIAGNRFFRQTLESVGMIILEHLEFTDHYRYKEADFQTIDILARQMSAQLIVTTEKDFARMDDPDCFSGDMAVITISMELTDCRDEFRALIKGLLTP
jgi:tetraacyldisaccharide 4'-kinase